MANKVETLKKFLQEKINVNIDILKIQMTKENIYEITYGDKLVSLGALAMAVDTMKQIDPTFEFDLGDYFPESVKEIERERFKKSWSIQQF